MARALQELILEGYRNKQEDEIKDIIRRRLNDRRLGLVRAGTGTLALGDANRGTSLEDMVQQAFDYDTRIGDPAAIDEFELMSGEDKDFWFPNRKWYDF